MSAPSRVCIAVVTWMTLSSFFLSSDGDNCSKAVQSERCWYRAIAPAEGRRGMVVAMTCVKALKNRKMVKKRDGLMATYFTMTSSVFVM